MGLAGSRRFLSAKLQVNESNAVRDKNLPRRNFGLRSKVGDGKKDGGDGARLVNEHITLLLNYSKQLYQGVCTCGWTSTIGSLEDTDLMRAMHAHAVVTFSRFQ